MLLRHSPVRFATVFACAALLTACASTPNGVSPLGLSDEVYNASGRATTLQSIRANDVQPVRDQLEVWLAGDIKTLSSRMKAGSLMPLDAQQGAAALRTLVVLAILQEKYPVESWKSDPEVQTILAWALEQDAGLTKSIRARKWSHSLLRAQ